MFKKILSLMLVTLMLCSCLAACKNSDGVAEDPTLNTDTTGSDTETDTDTDTDTDADTDKVPDDDNETSVTLPSTLPLNASTEGIRFLGGRTYATESQINVDGAGAGIEFNIFNTGRTITFSVETSASCQFKAFINGSPVAAFDGNEIHTVNGKGMITLSGLKGGNQTVRLVKLSGAETATAQLYSVAYMGVISNTAPVGEKGYIEFVGGTLPSNNVMLSDAFAVASANGAEYSILSELSLVCGNTDISAAYVLRSSKRDTTAYDFAKKATLVIVDLGAADYALSKTNSSVTAKAFAEKYKALIETIIDKNGTANAPCRVVCIYDSANGDFARAVTDVYAELGRQEAGVYTCQRISGDDGVMSNAEQADFMKRLQAVIELAKAGSITDRPMNSTENGNGMDVSYKDFVEVTVQKYTNISLTPTTAGVRLLGVRNLDSTTGVNCDWSCSGIEVSIAHSGGDVMFSVTGNNSQFRVWVDGVEWKNADGSLYYVFGSEGSGRITVPDVPMGTHTIRVVKVTSIDRARNQITSISLKGELRDTVAAPSELYIEYIGDSISCGWGVVGNYDGDYKSMDGTLAMPYMISQELGADYSVTAVSGRGVIYGDHAIPQSYLLAAPFKNDTESGMYDFARKADIVVVNIGTNDYTYKVDRAEFEAAYKALLDTIKEKNGADCKIVCVYNAMNDTCSENLLAACAAAGGEAAGIYTLKLAKASNPHSSALGHPTVEDNQKNAKAIIDFMELKNII